MIVKALVASIEKDNNNKDATDIEITWDMGLQEKSEKLLESYKGRIYHGVALVILSKVYLCFCCTAKKEEANMTLGEKYQRQRKLKKKERKLAVSRGWQDISFCGLGLIVGFVLTHAQRPRKLLLRKLKWTKN